MEPWWSFAIAAASGGVLLVGAALLDRRARRRTEALRMSTPERDVELEGNPTYVPVDDVLARPITLQRLTEEDAAALLSELVDAQEIAAGWASDRFATHAGPTRAILRDPLVLIGDEIGAVRELITPLQRSRQLGRPLILVTADMLDDTLETLAANRVHLNLGLLVIKAEPAMLAELRDLLQTTGTSRADLQSGYLPESALAQPALWVSDAARSWVKQPQPSSQG